MSSTHPTPAPSATLLAALRSPENRTAKLFRLIDRPSDPPPEVQQRSSEFIASQRWTYATTMAFAPHEYVVRAKTHRDFRDAYDQLWHDIQTHGYRGRFGRNLSRYLSVQGWRYWSCDLVNCTAPATPARAPTSTTAPAASSTVP